MPYIDTNEFEKRIKPYDTDDPVDKALYNFAHNKMMDTSTADVVERSAYDQVRWERDVAIAQLASIGKGFGEAMDDVGKVVRCKDCKWCEDADGLMCKNVKTWVVATGSDFGCILAERRDNE